MRSLQEWHEMMRASSDAGFSGVEAGEAGPASDDGPPRNAGAAPSVATLPAARRAPLTVEGAP